MEVGRAWIRISGGSHEADHVSPFYPHPLAQAVRVPVQVGVVIAIHAPVVEFVDGVASRFAEEEPAYGSRNDGMHRRPFRTKQVDGFVRMPEMSLIKRIPHVRNGQPTDRGHHVG